MKCLWQGACRHVCAALVCRTPALAARHSPSAPWPRLLLARPSCATPHAAHRARSPTLLAHVSRFLQLVKGVADVPFGGVSVMCTLPTIRAPAASCDVPCHPRRHHAGATRLPLCCVRPSVRATTDVLLLLLLLLPLLLCTLVAPSRMRRPRAAVQSWATFTRCHPYAAVPCSSHASPRRGPTPSPATCCSLAAMPS